MIISIEICKQQAENRNHSSVDRVNTRVNFACVAFRVHIQNLKTKHNFINNKHIIYFKTIIIMREFDNLRCYPFNTISSFLQSTKNFIPKLPDVVIN